MAALVIVFGMPGDATFSVGLGSSGSVFNAEFSLETGTGHGTWTGADAGSWVPPRRSVHRALSFAAVEPEVLERFREVAAQMREHGSEDVRCDQFPQATVRFDADDGAGDKVSWVYHVEGGLPRGLDDVYDAVADVVWREVAAQREQDKKRPRLLPRVSTEAELMKIHASTEPWLPATREVARRHGFEVDGWERSGDGSNIVMLGSRTVLKFFPPFWPATGDCEEAAMDLAEWRLPVATPRVLARGKFDGWNFLGVSRVQGTALRDVTLSASEELALATALGAAIRALHDIPVPQGSKLHDEVPSWRAFLSDHRKRRAELETARGTSPEWTARLVEYLRPWRYRKRPTRTFLHADLTYEHILMCQNEGQWELAGIIDFGDAKVGDAAYDFAAPFAFWTADRPDLRAAMLDAYGATDPDAFVDRIFEALLLHEFGRLAALELDGLETIEDLKTRYATIT